MKNNSKPIYRSLLFILIAFNTNLLNAQSSQNGKLILQFNHLFNNESLEFGKEYTNAHGEKLTIKTLNYFISNIELLLDNGETYNLPQDSSYFLIKHSEKASQQIALNHLPAKKINGIRFLVGVDSARNTFDVSRRTGSLDVGARARGMYWSWNSGYIFFKLEGKSPVIPDSLANNFYYHIGGFGGYESKTINNIRQKQLEFKRAIHLKKQTPIINIQVDVAPLFNYRTPILLSKNSNVMWGELSVKISENYISSFNLGSIHFQEPTQLP